MILSRGSLGVSSLLFSVFSLQSFGCSESGVDHYANVDPNAGMNSGGNPQAGNTSAGASGGDTGQGGVAGSGGTSGAGGNDGTSGAGASNEGGAGGNVNEAGSAGAFGGGGASGQSGSGGTGGSAGLGGSAGSGGSGGSSGTTSAAGADAGDGDAGADASVDAGPDRPLGDPIQAPDGTWTWIDFPDSRCRSGSTTGIGVNWASSSKKLVIYLEPGGACFSPDSCSQNRASRDGMFGGGGIFDRNNDDNPFADWNHVFVPYCTGDWHAGNNPNGNVPGVGPQQFMGYVNMELFLDRLIPTFPDIEQVVLTGSSAGGLGAFFDASLVARRFKTVPIVAIIDSGPPTSTKAMPACFQQRMRELWNLDATVLADCGADCSTENDYLVDLTLHFARGANHSTGIINAYDDAVDIDWYDMGGESCPVPAPELTAQAFEEALIDLRTAGGGAANRFATYYIPSTGHVWLGNTGITVDNVRLSDWTADLLNGVFADVGP